MKNLSTSPLLLREIGCPGSIVRPSIGGCRPPDPGSNPGQGATLLTIFVSYIYTMLLVEKIQHYVKEQFQPDSWRKGM